VGGDLLPAVVEVGVFHRFRRNNSS
jgi:hypothetical protein